jgi:hypothetical protein
MPKFVRVGADGFDVFGLHRAVNLHLLKARVVVALHPHLRIGGRIHACNPDCIRAISVHDSRQQHVWAESLAAVHRVSHGGDELEFVAYITDGCNARRQVNRPPLHLLVMSVHIPQAGNDVFTGDVNTLGIRRNFYFFARTGGDYFCRPELLWSRLRSLLARRVNQRGTDEGERSSAVS